MFYEVEHYGLNILKQCLVTEFQYSLIYEKSKTFLYKSYTKWKHLVVDTSNARYRAG